VRRQRGLVELSDQYLAFGDGEPKPDASRRSGALVGDESDLFEGWTFTVPSSFDWPTGMLTDPGGVLKASCVGISTSPCW
jgi:hypothetical protein